MEPSCGWICNRAIVWLDEFAVVKILDRIEKSTGCPRFDPVFGSNNNPLFGPLSIMIIAEHSIFVGVTTTTVAGWLSEDKLHGGCSGKTGKPHYVMKPSCGWISARGQHPKKITVVKIFDRRKNPKMSRVWPFMWMLSLDYYLAWCRGLSRSSFIFTVSR